MKKESKSKTYSLFSGGDGPHRSHSRLPRLDATLTLGSAYSLLCGEKLRRKRYSIVFALFSDSNRRASSTLQVTKPSPPTQKGHLSVSLALEVTAGFEPADNGVADRGLTTWLRHQTIGADYGARTRHLDLGKVALYQMS